ncbi:DNA-directed RNA polymerase sigma-70 factor [Gemmatimonadetes bacterium T265]|nr:DNA-directed RNA polymerase sigma-70 factor [Gemmatimonadetes bacterium T265]
MPPAAAALEHFEPYRPALTGHCYRMLGSVMDAEDAVQEAMLRAWKAADRFEGRSGVRTWLTRIATNVCLDALAAAGRTPGRRRARPVDEGAGLGAVDAVAFPLPERPREHWVEPIADAAALPAPDACDPERQAILRESIRLAFVAALQYLPPRQRAALLLTQVLGWTAVEAGETLGMTTAAVNSALQRARATLDARNPAVAPRALSPAQQDTVARYVAAFERYDVAALARLLHDEATLSMPPFALWLRGPHAITQWLAGPGAPCRGSRLVPVEACGGTPAWAQYRDDGATPWALLMIELRGDRVASMTSFLDVETLFPRFGLPMRLTDERAGSALGKKSFAGDR